MSGLPEELYLEISTFAYYHPLYSVSYDSLSSTLMNGFDADVVEIDFPFKSLKYDNQLLCSCNGLLLFWSEEYYHFYLWNPVTEKCKGIPESHNCYIFAFGYDCKTRNCKLVNVVDFEDTNVKDVGGEAGEMQQGQDVIISLDISDERFEHIQVPNIALENEALANERDLYKNVGVLERCLSLFVNVDGICELWVMQDYGVHESWTKRYIINFDNITTGACEYVRVMRTFKDGEILLKLDEIDVLVVYDPKQGSARKKKVCGLELREAINYFESLVSR
ncbi:F-box protein At3g07870-like [Papaver somniferum]|uniref:F-box protein At3g07870-like n=1 Tax=Papaver somniferum TaxID=3469 RepID=UPI000E700B6B|nr:F-box protein At3g07870-like [Papaver somniferum]